jgi:hypothetical protein
MVPRYQVTPAPARIKDANDNIAGLFFCIFGIGWVAVAWVGLYLAENKGSIWPAVFVSVPGVALFVAGSYSLMCLIKYGRSVFDAPSLPAFCGGGLAGTIRLSKPLVYREPIQLRLSCVQLVSGNRGSHEHVMSEDHCTLDNLAPDSVVAEIPVFFNIPRDGSPTAGKTLYWVLDAKIKAPVVSYAARFKVPVAAGPPPQSAAHIVDRTVNFRSPQPARHGPLDRHIHFTPLPGGGGQVELLGTRNLRRIWFPFIAASVFIIAAQLWRFGKSDPGRTPLPLLVFSTMLSLMGVAFLLIGISSVLISTIITAGHGSIVIRTGMGPFRRRLEIPANAITEIAWRIQGQAAGRPLYTVIARLKSEEGGGYLTLCGAIYAKNDADWIARELSRELGITGGTGEAHPVIA